MHKEDAATAALLKNKYIIVSFRNIRPHRLDKISDDSLRQANTELTPLAEAHNSHQFTPIHRLSTVNFTSTSSIFRKPLRACNTASQTCGKNKTLTF